MSPSESLLGLGAHITCAHGLGRVVIARKPAPGEPDLLTQADLEGAPIAGCPFSSPMVRPCTRVLKITAGLSVDTRGPNGSPAVTRDVTALTDGTPPGAVGIRVL
jgi:hypothetical protein